jgi:ADP-L-glycero-D-manno-heptose 6-epimerase
MQETNKTSTSSMKLSNGLYNLGTGKARSFNDLVKATFAGMDKEPVIEYIDMPEDIRDKYQYFTEASMSKLHHAKLIFIRLKKVWVIMYGVLSKNILLK